MTETPHDPLGAGAAVMAATSALNAALARAAEAGVDVEIAVSRTAAVRVGDRWVGRSCIQSAFTLDLGSPA